jgi:hypothetical protein
MYSIIEVAVETIPDGIVNGPDMGLPKKVLVKLRSQIVAKKPWHLNPPDTVPPSDTLWAGDLS